MHVDLEQLFFLIKETTHCPAWYTAFSDYVHQINQRRVSPLSRTIARKRQHTSSFRPVRVERPTAWCTYWQQEEKRESWLKERRRFLERKKALCDYWSIIVQASLSAAFQLFPFHVRGNDETKKNWSWKDVLFPVKEGLDKKWKRIGKFKVNG